MTRAIVPADPAKGLAFDLFTEIAQRKTEIAKNFLALGRLFKRVRDEKLYKSMDFDSYEAFLGSPEISMRRSTVYSLIQIYEIFVERAKVSEDFLAQIGHAKLQAIAPIVKSRPEVEFEEWLYRAKELSRSDLIEEVRLAEGKPGRVKVQSAGHDKSVGDFADYREFVKAHPCVVCGAKEVDPAHFPKTRGAGAPDEWVIPMCRACHSEYHQDPYDWTYKYRDKWAAYFYKVFTMCYAILGGK